MNMWICTRILISCEIMNIFSMVKKERSTVSLVQLQNDCLSLQGDSANMGQSGLREQCENTFVLKANTQGEACEGPSIWQALTTRSFKVMTRELLADLSELQNEMGTEKEFDDSMEKSNL